DIVLFGAEYDAYGRIILGCAFLVIEQIQVEIHFSCMLGFEGSDLEIKSDQSLQKAVIEKQVYEIFLGTQRQSVLAADKAETIAELENKLLQSAYEPVFKFPFLNGAGNTQELQAVTAFHHFAGLFGNVFRQREGEIVRFLFLYGTFVGLGLDLVEEDATAPSESGGGTEVVDEWRGRLQSAQHEHKVPPGNTGYQISHMLREIFGRRDSLWCRS